MPPAPSRSSTSPGPGDGRVGGFDAQIFLGVNAAGEHGDVSFRWRAARTARTVGGRQCSASQPVLKRLYAWLRCRCIAARAPGTSCAAIAFSTARCSAIAAVHSAGES